MRALILVLFLVLFSVTVDHINFRTVQVAEIVLDGLLNAAMSGHSE